MDVTNVALIAVVIAVVMGLLIWWLARRRICRQCGCLVPPGQTECSSCHASLHSNWTAFQRFPTGRLAFIDGPRVGQELELRGKQVRIGRAPHSDVRLDDDLVSWEHAILSFSDGQYMLFDQDSTNGTWVNGQRVAQCVIQPGVDQIRIGPSVFVVKAADQRLPTPSPLPMSTPPKAPVERVYGFGDYERVATLGGGGASVVYKAISRRDGQTVAIKVLLRHDPYLRDKFQKEGKELARLLRHPHIVRVYGGGESRGMHYLVMEFMEGGTLRERLFPGRPLPPSQVVNIAGQVCDALQYAHRMGIYHRDIKPENVFFSSDGRCKLGDFGIARMAQSVTRTASGWLLGTPLYMSFEQAKGHPIDGRSDLYSLGVVLYEMVTGRCPFVAEGPLVVVDKHIQEQPVPPSHFNPHVPAHIEQAIMRALEKDRDQRFSTAGEIARALGYARPMHEGERARVSSLAIGRRAARLRGKPRPFARFGALQLVREDGTAIPLRGKTTALNRGTVNPGDLEISRTHARVAKRAGHYWVVDIGSSNGTFVNGLRIFGPQVLRVGDQVQVGRTVLRVEG
jgi:pSer/pThr/pTyr-binding forkhead associated (FHA) protein